MKKSILVYASWEDSFELLTVEEQAQFLKNLFLYNRGEEPILNTSGLKMLWATIKFSLDRDKQAYANKVEGARKTTVLRESNRRDSNDTVQNTTMSYDTVQNTTMSYDTVQNTTMSYDVV